jgi:hypothetical protein
MRSAFWDGFPRGRVRHQIDLLKIKNNVAGTEPTIFECRCAVRRLAASYYCDQNPSHHLRIVVIR